MKTLLILRHGKSSWKDPGLVDHERPLNKRGKHDAPRMGRLLREHGYEPELILSSTARRARQTAKLVAEESRCCEEVILVDDLYGGGPGAYIEALQTQGGVNEQVLVVGHNPDLEELLETLTGESQSLPTAALAVVRLPIKSWDRLADDTQGELVQLWTPRELDG